MLCFDTYLCRKQRMSQIPHHPASSLPDGECPSRQLQPPSSSCEGNPAPGHTDQTPGARLGLPGCSKDQVSYITFVAQASILITLLHYQVYIEQRRKILNALFFSWRKTVHLPLNWKEFVFSPCQRCPELNIATNSSRSISDMNPEACRGQRFKGGF